VKIWQVILATLVIFGTGVVTGGLLVDYSNRGQHRMWRMQKMEGPRLPVANQRRESERFPQPIQMPPHAGLRTNFVERLARDLKLTPDQRRRIERIVSESQERAKELWKEHGQPFRKEIQETKESIRAALTPEQRERFEELMQRSQQPRKPDEPQLPDSRLRQRDIREPRPLPPQNFREPPRNP